MRIAQLIDDLEIGGAEQLVGSLARALRQRGHDSAVICLREIGRRPVDICALRAAGVELIALGKPDGPHPRTVTRLSAQLASRRIEVLHTHNHLVHHYGVVAARLARTPAVLSTIHGSESIHAASRSARILYLLSSALSLRTVAVCRPVLEVLRDAIRIPERKLCVIENGIDLTKVKELERGACSGAKTLGAVGRFEAVKDHRTLLRAFALVRQRYPDVQLRLLGGGSLAPALERLARRLGIGEAVHFEGFSDNVADFLARIDVYVLSSRSEGLPLSLLEAMGAGLPVVATAVGEVPRIVRTADCGWLAPPESPEDLAAAIEEALAEGDLTVRGTSAREAALRYFSLERMTDDYEALYRMLLHESGRAQGEDAARHGSSSV